MTMLSARREVGEFKERYKWMALFVVLALCGIVARLVHLQLIDGDRWVSEAERNILKRVRLPATRGLLRDSAGRLVASNRPSFDLYVTPAALKADDIDRLARLMGFDATAKADLNQKLSKVSEKRRTHIVELYRDISRDQFAAIEVHKREFRGAVVLVARPVRKYPYASLAAHAIGFLNEVSAEDLKRFPDRKYKAGDLIGRGGIEAAWESYLRGQDGELTVAVDVSGRAFAGTAKLEQGSEVRREANPGRDLRLTLDMELMKFIDKAFRQHAGGAAVVVDVHTGRVRALYSKPGYDLNEMSGGLSQKRHAELSGSPFRPLIDKTVYDTYYPGSTFKPISALVALEDSTVPASERVKCGGYYQLGNRRFHCTHSHGPVDMRRAIIQSCNVYFYKLAEQVGLERIEELATDFGLGAITGIGINTESAGIVPTREWYLKTHETYSLGFALNTAIGQGDTRVTVIQLAMMYAAMANGGDLYMPQLVQAIEAPDGSLIEEFPPRIRRHIPIAKEHMTYVIDAMSGVVNDPKGTAYAARMAGGATVAGKTGTAQVTSRTNVVSDEGGGAAYHHRTHAWFAAFAPVQNPKLSIVVLVEHGGHGGVEAAPIAIKVLNEALGTTPVPPPKTPALAGNKHGQKRTRVAQER